MTAVTTSTTPAPSADLSLTDPTTWVMILTAALAALASIYPHFNGKIYVAPAAILAATVVSAIAIWAKHHRAGLRDSLIATGQTLLTGVAQECALPATAPSALRKVADDIEGAAAKVEGALAPKATTTAAAAPVPPAPPVPVPTA